MAVNNAFTQDLAQPNSCYNYQNVVNQHSYHINDKFNQITTSIYRSTRARARTHTHTHTHTHSVLTTAAHFNIHRLNTKFSRSVLIVCTAYRFVLINISHTHTHAHTHMHTHTHMHAHTHRHTTSNVCVVHPCCASQSSQLNVKS